MIRSGLIAFNIICLALLIIASTKLLWNLVENPSLVFWWIIASLGLTGLLMHKAGEG